MVTLDAALANPPDQAYVFEKGSRQEASAHLISSSVIHVEIGRRPQMAAIQDWLCHMRAVTRGYH